METSRWKNPFRRVPVGAPVSPLPRRVLPSQSRHGGKALFLGGGNGGPGPLDVVWELYAGVGAMGQLMARKAKLVWAVEENAQAVHDGIDSLELNGIDNVRFRQGQCELVLARVLLKDKPTVVLLDPPRAGCEKSVLKSVMRAGPVRMVYVSCDPGTLARDAQYLSTGGYHLKRSVPVDLFPQTAHIESVTLFELTAR